MPRDYLAEKQASFQYILISSSQEELQNNTQTFHFYLKVYKLIKLINLRSSTIYELDELNPISGNSGGCCQVLTQQRFVL